MDLSDANTARGHREVQRSMDHIMVISTTQIKGYVSVKKSKRGARRQKAATVLPNRTAAA